MAVLIADICSSHTSGERATSPGEHTEYGEDIDGQPPRKKVHVSTKRDKS